MYYIFENNIALRDANGQKITYASKDEARQAIDYFGDELQVDYRLVSIVDYALGLVSEGEQGEGF